MLKIKLFCIGVSVFGDRLLLKSFTDSEISGGSKWRRIELMREVSIINIEMLLEAV